MRPGVAPGRWACWSGMRGVCVVTDHGAPSTTPLSRWLTREASSPSTAGATRMYLSSLGVTIPCSKLKTIVGWVRREAARRTPPNR